MTKGNGGNVLLRLRAGLGPPRSREAGMPSRRQSKYPLRGLIDAIGRWFSPNPDSEVVTTLVLLDAPPEAVWKALRFYEEIPDRPALLLLALLPRPIGSEGRKTQVGADIRCLYDGGYLVKRITSAQPGQLLRFEVLEQSLGIENSVSMREGSYAIRAVGGGSQVLLTTHYHGHLRPRFLWRPFERSFAHAVHRHILGGMSALLGASAAERASSVAGRLAPALGEPPSP